VQSGGGAVADLPRHGPERLPTWWLFVLGSWVPPQGIFWSVIQSIIVPIQVQRMVGDADKTIYLGYISTLASLGGVWGPCIGHWSDNCTSRWGRRRPFMFVGSFVFVIALAVLNCSHTFWPYACGMFLFTFMANFNCTPFNSILPEIVPQGQRATSVAIGGWIGSITGQVSATLGVAVGQGWITNTTVYYIAAAVSLFYTLPVGQLIVGARPGCCTPEVPKAPPTAAEDAVAAERRSGGTRRGCVCCWTMREMAFGFTSAFRWRPFRYYAIVVMLQTVWANLQGLFYLYWFDDLIAPNFAVLGHHLTSSSQSALAITQSVTAVGSFGFALPGGWLGDRLGPLPVLITTGFLTCVFPVLNAFVPNCEFGNASPLLY
jgi:Na+/melibiose symporter-like transporter